MGKSGKSRLNPADQQRKKEAAKSKKRNREEKELTQTLAKQKDPEAIVAELKEIARREGQGYVDPVQTKRKRLLMEMHKKVTLWVKHEEKKEKEKERNRPETAPPTPPPAPLSPPAPPGFPLITPGVMPYPFPAAPLPYQAPAPPAAPTHAGGHLTDYQRSVQRLRHAQQEAEREKNFQDLLQVQLEAANRLSSAAAGVVEPDVTNMQHAAVVTAPKSQKPTTSRSNKRKIIETDALGNVVATAAPPSTPAVTPKPHLPAPVAKGAGLNLLSGYASAPTTSQAAVDPYDLFMAELEKQGV